MCNTSRSNYSSTFSGLLGPSSYWINPVLPVGALSTVFSIDSSSDSDSAQISFHSTQVGSCRCGWICYLSIHTVCLKQLIAILLVFDFHRAERQRRDNNLTIPEVLTQSRTTLHKNAAYFKDALVFKRKCKITCWNQIQKTPFNFALGPKTRISVN